MSARGKQTIGETVSSLLPSQGGRGGSLRDLLAGKRAAVVVFWSGVCSHCARYDEFLNSFTARHPTVALAVIACRQGETPQRVQAIAAKRGLRFPILFDSERLVAHTWLVQQTPRVFLVDSDSRLVYRGAIDNFKYASDPNYDGYLEAAIGDLLAGRLIGRPETPSFGCAIESVYYAMPRPIAR